MQTGGARVGDDEVKDQADFSVAVILGTRCRVRVLDVVQRLGRGHRWQACWIVVLGVVDIRVFVFVFTVEPVVRRIGHLRIVDAVVVRIISVTVTVLIDIAVDRVLVGKRVAQVRP